MVRLLQGWAGLFGVFVVLDVEGHAAFLSGLYRPHLVSSHRSTKETLLPHFAVPTPHLNNFSAAQIFSHKNRRGRFTSSHQQHSTLQSNTSNPQSDRGRKLGYVWTHDRQDGSISTLKSFPFHARKTGAGHGRGASAPACRVKTLPHGLLANHRQHLSHSTSICAAPFPSPFHDDLLTTGHAIFYERTYLHALPSDSILSLAASNPHDETLANSSK